MEDPSKSLLKWTLGIFIGKTFIHRHAVIHSQHQLSLKWSRQLPPRIYQSMFSWSSSSNQDHSCVLSSLSGAALYLPFAVISCKTLEENYFSNVNHLPSYQWRWWWSKGLFGGANHFFWWKFLFWRKFLFWCNYLFWYKSPFWCKSLFLQIPFWCKTPPTYRPGSLNIPK